MCVCVFCVFVCMCCVRVCFGCMCVEEEVAYHFLRSPHRQVKAKQHSSTEMKSSLPSERKSRLSELSAKLTQPHSSARARLAQEREAPDWPTALPGGTVFAEPVDMCFPEQREGDRERGIERFNARLLKQYSNLYITAFLKHIMHEDIQYRHPIRSTCMTSLD